MLVIKLNAHQKQNSTIWGYSCKNIWTRCNRVGYKQIKLNLLENISSSVLVELRLQEIILKNVFGGNFRTILS